MTRNQLEMLKKIMALEFSAIDLNLFLNTHPQCNPALDEYNKIIKQIEDLKEDYQEMYGPLSAMETNEYQWQYPKGNWPWQIKY